MRFFIWVTLTISLCAWSYFLGRGTERHQWRVWSKEFYKYSGNLMQERDACLEFLDEAPLKEPKIDVEDISI